MAFGRSLGTGVAVKLGAARPLAGLILVSPFDSLVALGRTHYPWLPVSALLRHRFDAAAEAPRIAAPLLAIVADRDSIIPNERSQALYDAWAGPEVVARRSRDRSQHVERAGRVLDRRGRLPRRPDLTRAAASGRVRRRPSPGRGAPGFATRRALAAGACGVGNFFRHSPIGSA
ncbi:MAG: hypothetical protein IPF60_12450 [Betaproteobacteria bacterium]|nr:hypothetical protein [Betaproteobacteria bacterium]